MTDKVKFEVGKTYEYDGFKITVTRRTEKSVWYTGNLYDNAEHRAKIGDCFKYAESVSLPWGLFCAQQEAA